jgi:hypothetical protein
MNDHSEDKQSLEENDRRFWHKVNFDTFCNDTEIKDKEDPHEIVAFTSIAPNFSHNKEVNDPWDDTLVWDIAISELKQSVNIGSCSLAKA